MYETIRIVAKLKPKYVIWENVKNLLSKKHRHNFDNYLDQMAKLGYQNFYQVLNAKDYGIPQNRERVFTISILGGGEFQFPDKQELDTKLHELLEQNVDEKYFVSEKGVKYIMKRAGGFVRLIENDTEIAHCPITAEGNANWTGNFVKFEFPPKQELTLRLKDMLEDNVDEKYFLSDKQVERMSTTTYVSAQTDKRVQDEVCRTLTARDWRDPKCVRIGGIYDTETQRHQAGSIWDKEGLAPTIETMQGGNRQPMITIKNNTKLGYLEAKEGDGVYTNVSTKRGTVQPQMAHTLTRVQDQGVVIAAAQRGRDEGQQLEISNREYANAITSVQKDSLIAEPKVINPLKDKTDYSWQFEQQVYDKEGIVRAIKAGEGSGNIPKIVEKPQMVGTLENSKGGGQGYRVYDSNGIATNQSANGGGIGGKSGLYLVNDNRNLKEKLCDNLIESGVVKGGEIINHSYTTSSQRDSLDKYIESDNGIMPTMTTRSDCLGVVVGENQKKIDTFPSMVQKCGDRGKDTYSSSELSYTIPANAMSDRGQVLVDRDIVTRKLRIRKLTPKECWRLMGFNDEEFEKAAKVNSNSQLYKQARKLDCG